MQTLGEDAAIQKLIRLFLKNGSSLLGDDAAVLDWGKEDLLLASDAVLEGIHFDPGENLKRVGRKATSRSLSDIAAMGGHAEYLLINLSLPGDLSEEAFETLNRGIAEQAKECETQVVGGDISESPSFQIHVFCLGAPPPRFPPFCAPPHHRKNRYT